MQISPQLMNKVRFLPMVAIVAVVAVVGVKVLESSRAASRSPISCTATFGNEDRTVTYSVTYTNNGDTPQPTDGSATIGYSYPSGFTKTTSSTKLQPIAPGQSYTATGKVDTFSPGTQVSAWAKFSGQQTIDCPEPKLFYF